MPVKDVAERAAAFGIYSETTFGNDLFAVIAAAGRGIEHARRGNGPALIEFKTFRRRGHGEHDDMAYVSKELREFWEERDPLAMYRRWLTNRSVIAEADLTHVDDDCVQRVDEAVEYAESLPFPKSETVTERLFAPSPHDPKPEDRKDLFEPIETPAIPALTASAERKTGEHF
jgi:TPP-dependent pyruvate/acetoin dehydrogenase alpha subunit